MKRLVKYLLTFVACAATAIFAPAVLHNIHASTGDMNNQTNAAFRDGLFLARLDAEQGRKPHLMSGRWSSDGDRRLFIAAYLQAYREIRGDAAEQMEPSQPAGKRGYRDGLADGLQRSYESRSFLPSATENYRKADHGYSGNSDDLNQYKQAYRQAYRNAYQLAFYGEPEEIQTAAVLRGRSPE
jgi:hypothetical protein